MRIESTPESIRSIGSHYGVNGANLSRQYKDIFSGYRQWKQLVHAEQYVIYPQNVGPNLAIDESSLSCGELYTFVTNRDAKTRKGSLVAVVSGTKSEDVIAVLERIDEDKLNQVKEVTLDLSDSMRRIIINVFPNA